ncbi:MAG: flagellar hook assembly protein FlgD [Candidatus Thiodiazotropha endolucinida]|uniref:Basal-body rod modification protein FlgD n=1 Tax=Candidatus Thiodiazotropha endolucinida TaxID=1655433 RepID=A0A7Z0VIZ6_9GAMM|nr:flagellar hook assembly protein FlgD [Candidatus Thiodiazotropha endolucinida]MBT3012604.1 flagellar hook assembly protein FlgD [Candidatus Thiodiazotropha sp. (ex Lucina pensylvanica)]MBT3017646.1 flagellar hook assembly protein FlgD [Candidatus Thiodiazotropha taylori]MBT3042377.1 flagellar hook assembly protein FlgD [Candidatus Thiodiazotropha sp. (ex Codakia orbicularis)]MBV2104746.1 flagellar hook assembly protein FlgD [Candidatus Thiodiazotropha sp. (ex Lucina aurantia)]MBT3024736.1 f
MTAITNRYDLYEDIGLTNNSIKQEKEQGQLGLEDFMQLLVTELTHQDPFKPMENSEMATQVSQFATVSGIDDLNNSFNELRSALTSDQALQAANLVGRDVLVESSVGALANGEPLQGSIVLPSSAGNVRVLISDQSGALVRELQLGTHEAGQVAFSWDGYDDAGDYVGDGLYQISAIANVDDAEMAPSTLVSAEVESVNLGGPGGVQLNLGGLGQISMNDVAQIQ